MFSHIPLRILLATVMTLALLPILSTFAPGGQVGGFAIVAPAVADQIWYQSVGRTNADAPCEKSSATESAAGWTKWAPSWEQWANDLRGGFVCNRQITWAFAPAVPVPAISPVSQSVNATVDSPITATTVLTPTNFTGSPAITYTIAPSLPLGLLLNVATGVVAGAPTATQSPTAYVITATSGTQSATATMIITVSNAGALIPTFGAPTGTADGFTVQINNYVANPGYSWSGTARASVDVAISGTGLVTVTSVASGTLSTVTVTTTRAGYTPGSATVEHTSLSSQIITFAQPAAMSVGGSQIVTSTATPSDLPVTLTSNSLSICSVTGFVVTVGFLAGTCSLTASQSGSATYAAATPITLFFTVTAPELGVG